MKFKSSGLAANGQTQAKNRKGLIVVLTTQLNFRRYRRLHKKGLPGNRITDYRYGVAAKSVTGIGTPFDKYRATQTPKASFFVSSHHAHPFSGNARNVSMVALAGLPKGRPVSLYAGSSNPVSVTTNQEIGTSGGDSLNKYKEAAAMLATIPTQNPQFIWFIAAVRRDMQKITATIHHIAADSEHEACRSLARNHICFFAGRVPAGQIKNQRNTFNNSDAQATVVAGHQALIPSV